MIIYNRMYAQVTCASQAQFFDDRQLGHSLLIFSFSSEIPPPAVRAGGPLPLYIIPKVRLTLEILHGRSVLLLELVLQCTVKFTQLLWGQRSARMRNRNNGAC